MRTTLDATHLVTAEEFARLPDDDHRYELVEGRVIRMSPPGARHGALAVRIAVLFAPYVEKHGLGAVMTESGFKLATNPDTVRGPDLSFVRRDRIPASGLPRGFWSGAPDLVVEIVSPDNRYSEIRGKVDQYLMLGTALVLVVDPDKKSVTQYRRGSPLLTLGVDDVLDGGDVVPGFQSEVRAIFEGF